MSSHSTELMSDLSKIREPECNNIKQLTDKSDGDNRNIVYLADTYSRNLKPAKRMVGN